MKAKSNPRYLLLAVEFDKVADWLNLPRGIRIESAQFDIAHLAILFRVTGRTLSVLDPTQTIPVAFAQQKMVRHKRRYLVEKLMWWPALGQKEPGLRR